jgi:hypothetical protein
MPHYKCEPCNYSTYRLPDMDRHSKTKKHLRNLCNLPEKVIGVMYNDTHNDTKISHKDSKNIITRKKPKEKKFKCDKCNRRFTERCNLYRHQKHYCTITVHLSSNTNESMDDKNIKITGKKKMGTDKDKEIEELKEQNKKLLDLATKNANICEFNAEANVINAKSTKKSMNMMSHAMKNWANAPPMKLLEGKEAMKLITYENKSKLSIEEVIIHQFNADTLDRFLGNVLIKEFKKEDQLDQSLWTTDSSRLCFIIKQIVGDTGSDRWVSDKSGIEITKLLISPLVKKVSEMMSDYVNKFIKEMKENVDCNEKKAKIAMERMYDAETVIRGIVKNDLRKEILKYIAPYFNVDVKNIEIQKV